MGRNPARSGLFISKITHACKDYLNKSARERVVWVFLSKGAEDPFLFRLTSNELCQAMNHDTLQITALHPVNQETESAIGPQVQELLRARG